MNNLQTIDDEFYVILFYFFIYIFVITNLTTLYNNIVNRARIQCCREQHRKRRIIFEKRSMKGETINSINKNTKYKIDIQEPGRELNKNLHELRANTFTFHVEVQTTGFFKRYFH